MFSYPCQTRTHKRGQWDSAGLLVEIPGVSKCRLWQNYIFPASTDEACGYYTVPKYVVKYNTTIPTERYPQDIQSIYPISYQHVIFDFGF
jgi:hypothetical protein